MDANPPPVYQALIVPALHHIQAKYGYLEREAVEQFAKDNGLPLYRIQAVASFFPHFRLTPPPRLTLRICQDMACHLHGAGAMLKELSAEASAGVEVLGTSCIGRCDRAPAACVSRHHIPAADAADAKHQNGHDTGHDTGHDSTPHEAEQEQYFLNCSTRKLKKIVTATLAGQHLRANSDVAQTETGAQKPRYPAADWMIDPYRLAAPDYAGAKKALAARRESLRKSAEVLQTQFKWSPERAEQFRVAADRRLQVNFPLDKQLLDAVRAWQTEDDWAKGPELGGWADSFFKELDDAHADLRGLGGAGIPATQKWKDVRDAVRTARRRRTDDRAFIVVNGDESEPGTFKDRELLLHFPHLIIEGVILAGLVTEASQGFIYIRHEYPEQIRACEAEIARAFGKDGPLATRLGRPFPLSVFVSPGGYICGEQSALIEAMSDRRGEPRNLPPKLETNGLDDRPTLVSNVETFAWVPYIYVKGGENYASQGVNGWKGRRFFSVSGDVNRPGVYEVPMGMTLRELLLGEQYCRGIVGGRKLKAFAPSGPSGGFLPATLTAKAGLPRKHNENKAWLELAKRRGFDPEGAELDLLDLELELNLFRSLSPTQALGAGVVVYAEGRDMTDQAVNAMEFYRNESCGKCVPCRAGSQKFVALGGNLLNNQIGAAQWENELVPLVNDLSDAMTLASICGLGRSVPVPLKTVSDYFSGDLQHHLAAANKSASDPANDPASVPAKAHAVALSTSAEAHR